MAEQNAELWITVEAATTTMALFPAGRRDVGAETLPRVDVPGLAVTLFLRAPADGAWARAFMNDDGGPGVSSMVLTLPSSARHLISDDTAVTLLRFHEFLQTFQTVCAALKMRTGAMSVDDQSLVVEIAGARPTRDVLFLAATSAKLLADARGFPLEDVYYARGKQRRSIRPAHL